MPVLVIDDDPDTLQLIADELQELGFVTISVVDGQKGIDIVEQLPVELVLTDIRMPGMPGFEILDHCKARVPPIPVVLMFGVLSMTNAAAFERGASGLLYKPFTAAQLEKLIAPFVIRAATS